MAQDDNRRWLWRWHDWLLGLVRRGRIPVMWLMIALACTIGVLAGFGAALFTLLIKTIENLTVVPFMAGANSDFQWWHLAICIVPALGLLVVAWFTRRFAPEAQGHGVPEVILAVARRDGVIRPRVSIVKILASGLCIGTGGSVGREGPIVQIGSSLGSSAGQLFKLSSRNIKVLVAAGAAAGISATFNAPIAGVIFASEIILGSFAVESLTPIVIASVLADVVQKHVGEHGSDPAFRGLHYEYLGSPQQLPGYFLLGLLCGLAAVSFTKMLYWTEDVCESRLKKWWLRAIVCGLMVGVAGALYTTHPPEVSSAVRYAQEHGETTVPPVFGVGYSVVDHALHLEMKNKQRPTRQDVVRGSKAERVVPGSKEDRVVRLDDSQVYAQLLWLLPLFFLKPVLTSVSLGGGGSGGIFAPSLYIGATLGACFGLVCNLVIPEASANPGVYAIVGMGAVVAGTTHGVLSAIIIVYEMTGNYMIILPIMIAAGVASIVAKAIDRESIYHKKLNRRGESLARGHEMAHVEHVMVRDVMLRSFPTVLQTATVNDIVRVAKANPSIESLPVMNDAGQLVGIIRPEDLHRVLDSDVSPFLVNAEDIALKSPLSVSPDENLLEALRDFGTRDVETLPVEVGRGDARRIVGLLLRSDVMRRYREEMLSDH
ncbi:MAG: chloride channel protein [Pirellulaceae bacterium]